MRVASPRRDRLTVLVADDHRILLDALAEVLAAGGIQVVATAENGRRAVELARKVRPDVAVLDVSMPVMGGLEAAPLIHQASPQTAVLFLTNHAEGHIVVEGLRLGAKGFVSKAQRIGDLLQAIQDVADGAIYVSEYYAPSMLEALKKGEAARPVLTTRESQVLRLIAEGKSTKQAAAAMAISARTAESHRAHLMQKLRIHDTAGLVRYAIRQGLIVA